MPLGFFFTFVMIKLAEQVFLSSNRITIISGWSKEFALAVRATCHYGNCALESQNDEDALCHGNSVAQFWLLHQ